MMGPEVRFKKNKNRNKKKILDGSVGCGGSSSFLQHFKPVRVKPN